MKTKTAIAAVLALTMSAGQLAFAQGNSNHDRGDYILVAIATGIIVQLMLGH